MPVIDDIEWDAADGDEEAARLEALLTEAEDELNDIEHFLDITVDALTDICETNSQDLDLEEKYKRCIRIAEKALVREE